METVTKSTVNLISVVFLLLVFALLIPNSTKLRFISGLIITVYMIQFTLPIITLVTQTKFTPPIEQDPSNENESDNSSILIQNLSSQLCKDIKQLIINRFAISEAAFTVSVTVEKNDTNELELKLITIRYYKGNESLSETELNAIAKYTADTLAAPCDILIEIPE